MAEEKEGSSLNIYQLFCANLLLLKIGISRKKLLIFVFDPLAILLIISATITYSQIKEKELPPDVKAIRNKLLEEIEEYINDGGIVDHFIERSKK